MLKSFATIHLNPSRVHSHAPVEVALELVAQEGLAAPGEAHHDDDQLVLLCPAAANPQPLSHIFTRVRQLLGSSSALPERTLSANLAAFSISPARGPGSC
jgi:hypothetical protein